MICALLTNDANQCLAQDMRPVNPSKVTLQFDSVN
jgi:hypothetical protein